MTISIQPPLEGIRELWRFRPPYCKGIVLMELLLLGLVGLGGLALLLQQKALPSKEDADKALEKLDKDLTDPDANTVVGKYKAFVQGDYSGAMPYLVNSSDKTLKTLAEHELDDKALTTGVQKVGMGDEWVSASKKFPALNRIFLDRASQWYVSAWPDLDNLWKQKAREQAKKISTASPQGITRKNLPKGWTTGDATQAIQPILDGTFARSGSYSIKLLPPNPKVSTSVNSFNSDPFLIVGNEVEYSAFVRTENTSRDDDQVGVIFTDATGGLLEISTQKIPKDLPFWNRVSGKVKVPANATHARISAGLRSKDGTAWIDDMSVISNGKELVKNRSFEER